MTPCERDALETFYQIRDRLTTPRITLGTYVFILNVVRRMVMQLENVSYGCASGKHSGLCTCKPGKPGYAMISRHYG